MPRKNCIRKGNDKCRICLSFFIWRELGFFEYLCFRIHAYLQLVFNSRLEEGFDDISLKDLDFKFLSLFERVFL